MASEHHLMMYVMAVLMPGQQPKCQACSTMLCTSSQAGDRPLSSHDHWLHDARLSIEIGNA